MIERICKNCGHYQTVEGIDRNTGLKVVDGYCHASREELYEHYKKIFE